MNVLEAEACGRGVWTAVESAIPSLIPSAAGSSSGTISEALKLRKAWLRGMGIGEEEISELSQSSVPPLQVEEERKHLQALNRLRGLTPTYDELLALARRHRVRQAETE